MGAKRIALVTDSTSDIPPDLLEQYSIFVQPHVIIWGEQQYRDRVDLQPEEFYRRLRSEKTIPTTSQASAEDFTAMFQRAIQGGAEAIVVIVVNSKFSGAYQSASQAAAGASVPVFVYDSRAVTMGLGWQVLAAARARESGGDAANMLAAADSVRQRVQLYIALDTLEYVYRGGRIGNASRLIGALLNIKPLLYVDHQTGVVEPAGRSMTRRKSIDLLYNNFFAQVGSTDHLHLAVLHGGAAAEAGELLERVRNDFRPVELLTNITCPVLGINTGPQALALCGYSDGSN
ncbi:MAG TPA: DegV family protein [Anaerolineaceae bacterium]